MSVRLRIRKWAKTTQYPLVEVEWTDAACDDEHDDEAPNEEISVVNRTCGYLYEITKAEVRLARDVSDEINTIRGLYGIPRSLIKEIKYYSTLAQERSNGAKK